MKYVRKIVSNEMKEILVMLLILSSGIIAVVAAIDRNCGDYTCPVPDNAHVIDLTCDQRWDKDFDKCINNNRTCCYAIGSETIQPRQ